MFQFIGYNFFADGDALNQIPTNVENIGNITLTNAIFDHFNVSKDTDLTFNSTIPAWDFNTALDATFNGNLNAGNIDFVIEQVSAVKIKRRAKGEFNWVTLKIIPIHSQEDFTFVFNDFLAISGTEYEYALVPVMQDAEGEYIISDIEAKFNGIFIGDSESVYKFLYDVNYGANRRNQQIGTFEPLGKKYPIIVANGILSYDSGSVSAAIINDDFDKTGVLDIKAITKKKELLKEFLTNHKPKLLRDWSNNAWIVFVTEAPQITYASNSGMRVPYVSFSWAQVGDINNPMDLYTAGLIDGVE